jgi:hypothetical protein
MGRRVRYAPEGGCLFEVTNRTQQGRFLFRPSPGFNEIALGVLGRAQRLYPVSICGVVLASNHYLCGAAHKTCYVEHPVMWSWRTGGRQGRPLTALHCT